MIIRRDAAYEQYSHVTIRHSDQTELPSDLGIREHSHITGYLTVRRTAQRSLQSDMSVWEKSFITGSVVVRQYGQNGLHGSMNIWKMSIFTGHISVWQKSLLPGAIQVQIYDDILSSIYVVTEYRILLYDVNVPLLYVAGVKFYIFLLILILKEEDGHRQLCEPDINIVTSIIGPKDLLEKSIYTKKRNNITY